MAPGAGTASPACRKTPEPPMPSRPSIFISYRNKEHRDLALLLSVVLDLMGYRVLSDFRNGARRHQVSLTRTLGRDRELLERIEQADVVLLLAPRLRRLPGDGANGDAIDLFFSVTSVMTFGTYVGWSTHDYYLSRYGINVTKKHEETWQAWEARMATALGLRILEIDLSAATTANEWRREVASAAALAAQALNGWGLLAPERTEQIGRGVQAALRIPDALPVATDRARLRVQEKYFWEDFQALLPEIERLAACKTPPPDLPEWSENEKMVGRGRHWPGLARPPSGGRR